MFMLQILGWTPNFDMASLKKSLVSSDYCGRRPWHCFFFLFPFVLLLVQQITNSQLYSYNVFQLWTGHFLYPWVSDESSYVFSYCTVFLLLFACDFRFTLGHKQLANSTRQRKSIAEMAKCWFKFSAFVPQQLVHLFTDFHSITLIQDISKRIDLHAPTFPCLWFWFWL